MRHHDFCRILLKTTIEDCKKVFPELNPKDFSVTKSTLRGYEIQGPGRFYHYAAYADCKYDAKAEAIAHYVDSGHAEEAEEVML